jgi:C-terminal peptidase prc
MESAVELEKAVRAVRELYYTGSGEEVRVEAPGNVSLEGLVSLLDKESMLVDRNPSSLDYVRGLKEEGSVTDARFLEKNIAYIKVNFFGRRTGVDFENTLNHLGEGKVSGLIIDLRDNPGGVLQSALDVLDYFVPGDRLLITEVHKNGRKQYFSQDKTQPALTNDLPIVVLINASTASSTEIVAATLRHYRGAVIVGQRSYAKGTIQEVIPLSAKKTLVLTTGEYTLVDGSSLKDTGIVPDYLVEGKERQLETAVSILTGR